MKTKQQILEELLVEVRDKRGQKGSHNDFGPFEGDEFVFWPELANLVEEYDKAPDQHPERFLLFYGSDYYPCGGLGDFWGRFKSVTDAVQAATEKKPDWYQVVDSITLEIVAKL